MTVAVPVDQVEHRTVADVDGCTVCHERYAGSEDAVVLQRVFDPAVAGAVDQIVGPVAVHVGEPECHAEAVRRGYGPVAARTGQIEVIVENRGFHRADVEQDAYLSCRIGRFFADQQIKLAVAVVIVPNRHGVAHCLNK